MSAFENFTSRIWSAIALLIFLMGGLTNSFAIADGMMIMKEEHKPTQLQQSKNGPQVLSDERRFLKSNIPPSGPSHGGHDDGRSKNPPLQHGRFLKSNVPPSGPSHGGHDDGRSKNPPLQHGRFLKSNVPPSGPSHGGHDDGRSKNPPLQHGRFLKLHHLGRLIMNITKAHHRHMDSAHQSYRVPIN
uniref:Salivary acidic proline-rich phosphoprotein 1/2-like n=1 Tax=Nicotiana sylvestris TaxID=4096 RepID=A0A1U7X8L2_NICSY|nr:PREDICTED: salivary acidic proline-rich phosphoprotein 1/2-like [Nicotiana sylvestris]